MAPVRLSSSRTRPSSRSASSIRLRAVMSRAIFEAPMTAPAASLIGDTVREMSSSVPSFRTRTVS